MEQTLPVGNTIPDLHFHTPDGRQLRLSQLQSDTLVLIFLRHLA
jgi:peroxiredoxin